MADPASYGNPDRDVEQALVALKKGTQLIKYSRQGKPKFCPFRVSPDETTLIWYSRGSERNLKLSTVERIIPGQRTPVFRRFLRPDKDYLSFSLIYNNGDRSLDLICKDKAETEVWIAGLKALISTGIGRGRRTRSDIPDLYEGAGDSILNGRPFGSTLDLTSSIPRGRVSVDLGSRDINSSYPISDVGSEGSIMQGRTSGGGDGFRLSVSSTPSCSSTGSGPDDIESLGDVYVWGEIWSDGVSTDRYGNPIPIKSDVLLPKPLESNVVLDVQQIACGCRHVALVTRQGEVFTWGEESGGRLGHGIEKDFSRPRLVEYLAVTNVEFVACGEHHTCAVSTSGDLYTWGDGSHNAGLLGHGNDISHWIPKRVSGPLEGLQVLSVACGTWHSALATSSGKLFTFGDGSFGVLGHGDRESVAYPKEVQLLSGLKTVKVACGMWHTAAIVEVTNQPGSNSAVSKKLFTWGDGDKNRLGHGNKETYLLPTCVSALIDYNFHQIACGNNLTVALTTSGHIFTMGSNACGQLGNPESDGKQPCLVQDRLVGEFVEEIACGESHVAALTSRSEAFTWGKGANGRLGHGDLEDRNIPTFVEALKDRHVKNIACGSNYTATICIHKWVSGADQSLCSGCRQAFGFTRKRHNCYNCGLVHCHACSSKKALKAALAPTPGKPHRVCDSCYLKLKKAAESGNVSTLSRKVTGFHRPTDSSIRPDRVEMRSSRLLLSPKTESVKYLEIKSANPAMRADYSMVRASQVPSLVHLKDMAFPGSLGALQYALKPVTTAPPMQQQLPMQLPSSQPASNSSRPASPYSRRPSPPRAVTPVFSRGVIDSLKKTNELLNQEVSKLQNQMKSLKQKSEFQDEEMRKLKGSVQEATSLAAERSSKCSMAVKVVKSIATQLKEVTEKLPSDVSETENFISMQTQVDSFLEMVATPEAEADFSSEPNLRPVDNNVDTPRVREIQQNADGTSRDSNGSSISEITEGAPHHLRTVSRHASLIAAREVVEQFEPGVYVTLIQHSDGSKTFKRVKFSKRRFVEQQAEEWWKLNKDRLLQKYNTPKGSNTPPTEPSGAEASEEQQSETAQTS